mmetsp:Transcript_27062/g.71189  ORF Transcript_27062/g.71189 Transcript_27062/m.71189 type:complete len:124 (-) Transcript_27062:186-557(-)
MRVGTPRRRPKTKAGSCELARFENVLPFREVFPSRACSSRAFCRRAALEVVKLGDFFAHSWERIFGGGSKGSPGDVSEVARTRESARSNGILACERFCGDSLSTSSLVFSVESTQHFFGHCFT